MQKILTWLGHIRKSPIITSIISMFGILDVLYTLGDTIQDATTLVSLLC